MGDRFSAEQLDRFDIVSFDPRGVRRSAAPQCPPDPAVLPPPPPLLGGQADFDAQLGRRGRLLTCEGWGHGSYQRTACTEGAVDRYLVALILPPPGARCPAA